MEQKITITDTGDLPRAAEEFLSKIGNNRIIAFFAPMGAGKTTFTTAICERLGVEDAVCSPTFTIINEYRTRTGEPLYHFDFYRINRLEEAVDLGLDDYFYSGALCIIEWPENITGLLPEETLKVHITVNPDLSRTVVWED
ncbi:MAG: tRNA (adenosine(37)-N6)-threonylcarbamoyltransferase complex ATPase subunit type 1 TsaE [Bacteroidetes bacterium]|uniref:tRNA threonylcarbamoyladenosine biosynthesis protein TsaE n=1 Tax=Candidatus Cryptobacteroides excrementavium TaxID=2840759 RepID=A0A9D9J2C5_9BACT|nr:tRNA (adenosine(37)-N6)-threonylcarbamoyltransferase complex ATPase subunit type 1 TsaE [Candidatus Cryptobacteroides excrementavium]